MCKEKFDNGASLATHKNEEHNIIYFCHHCSVNFPDQEGLSDHQRTIHKPNVAYMSGPGDMVRKVIRTASDGELSPFLTENDGVCSRCKRNGHGSAPAQTRELTVSRMSSWRPF
jgi:hypothetical protein